MYQIAVCDDMQEDLDKAEKLLAEYRVSSGGTDFMVERFTNADGLLYRIEEGTYLPDLLLLDICLPGESGIELAQKLRKGGFTNPIIFLTASRKHALDAYQVDAMQYLVKPVDRERFFFVLDRVFEGIEKESQKYIILHIGRKLCRIQLGSIVYCEAQGNYQRIYFQNGEMQSVRMTMTELCGYVQGQPAFVRAGIAYLLNLSHVDMMDAQEVRFDTGWKIHLPRGVYPALKEQYFRYYCER